MIESLRRELAGMAGAPVLLSMRSPGLRAVVDDLALGKTVADDRLMYATRASPPAREAMFGGAGPVIIPSSAGGGSVAVVPVRGVALYDVDWPPFAFSTRRLARTVGQLASDKSVSRIILDVDSPGGSVTGTSEAADAVYAARQRKPVSAIINPLCASAAYWISSQASEIIASPSAETGSIGVYMIHADYSRALDSAGVAVSYVFSGEYKTEGNPHEPLSADARQHYQHEVNSIHRDFLHAVARGRGRSVSDVRENLGKGRTLMAPAALRAGMVDSIATADEAISRVVSVAKAAGSRADRIEHLQDAWLAAVAAGDESEMAVIGDLLDIAQASS